MPAGVAPLRCAQPVLVGVLSGSTIRPRALVGHDPGTERRPWPPTRRLRHEPAWRLAARQPASAALRLRTIMPKTIRLFGVPMDLGQRRRGVDMGPSALRYAGLDQRLRSLGYEVIDNGNLNVPLPE